MKFPRPFFLTVFFAVGGYLFLSWLFLIALLDPYGNAEFIYRTAIFIFFAEFLRILLSLSDGQKPKWFAIMTNRIATGIYFINNIAVSYAIKNIYLALMIIVSSISKYSGDKSTFDHQQAKFSFAFFLIFSPLILSLIISTGLDAAAKFKNEHALLPVGSFSGINYLLLWGVIYYFLLAFFSAERLIGKTNIEEWITTKGIPKLLKKI